MQIILEVLLVSPRSEMGSTILFLCGVVKEGKKILDACVPILEVVGTGSQPNEYIYVLVRFCNPSCKST